MVLGTREWLETDGLGGFASGTASGIRTRRYHGVLLVATTPPTGRVMLVNGFDAWLETADGTINISTQRYSPDVLHPDGVWRLDQFQHDPWPTWRWRVSPDVDLIQEIFVPTGTPRTVVRWRLVGGLSHAVLHVRPYLSGRGYHALHRENAGFTFDAVPAGPGVVEWHPYSRVPGIRSRANGEYVHAPAWYRDFLYLEERNRGLDDTEDLASPGTYQWDLTSGEAVWIVEPTTLKDTVESPLELALRHRQAEVERRRHYLSRLHRSADQYIVKRGAGRTVVAGYPWFTDFGRDTFIALPGICLATGRVSTARRILLQWAEFVSEGMLPNRFPDAGVTPEYDSVDSSLWFIIAVHDLLVSAESHRSVTEAHSRRLMSAVNEILGAYTRGTRYGIRVDADGLLAAGEPGVHLTWMNARIGELVVTPRIGKPVEVQALWLNALSFAGKHYPEWRRLFERALPAFRSKFWNPDRGCLYDVVDVDHVAGKVDARLRPNQVLAIGGLPISLLSGPRAKQIVDVIERSLLTPMGLRSLAPGEPGYEARYEGNAWARDHAYHNGTVWPWLMAPFVDAWARARDDTRQAQSDARDRFVRPLLTQLDRLGLGHLPEIADAELPFTPRGCPFNARSVGALLHMTSGSPS